MIISGAFESPHETDLGQFGFPPPTRHPRRLRISPVVYAITAETTLTPKNLVLPIFITDGIDELKPISSLPGVVRHTENSLIEAVRRAAEAGISVIDLFGVPLDTGKGDGGFESWNPEGVLNCALRRFRDEFGNDILIMADTCPDEFTGHGHYDVPGIDRFGDTVVESDRMLVDYVKIIIAQADAGTYIVSPSGMMDGQVAAIRKDLDATSHEGVSIMTYSAKYVLAFYDPLHETVGNSLQGDRRTYQQSPADRRESPLEVRPDINESADMVVVKSAMSYLNILRKVVDISPVPVVAYQVSGEYVMIHVAAANGWIGLDVAMMEAVLSIRRANAEQISTYATVDSAKKLRAQF